MARKSSKMTESDRSQGRALRDLASAAVDEALRLAPLVDALSSSEGRELAIDLDFRSADDAIFVRKRVNEALAVAEWDDIVSAWVWQRELHQREPLTERGRSVGWELRLERAADK